MLRLWFWLKDLLAGRPELGGLRSAKWPAFRKQQIALRGGKCEICGSTEKLELHHIESFASNPARELDPTNVSVLCESNNKSVICHRFFGHKGDYKKINPEVKEDIAIWKKRLL